MTTQEQKQEQKADIVVAGAGHNSLITAAYLAKAGYSVIVLDARPIPGGGACTEEPLLPGYKIDTCSTGHTLIRVNPLLTKDELGLHSKYGLRYLEPDPVAHVRFPDGEYLTHWLDIDRTCEEIARFSKHDADAYRRMMGEYDSVKGAYAAARNTPPGMGPSLQEMLLETPHGSKWVRIEAMSSWDVIRHEFEDRHIQAYMLWQAFMTVQAVDAPGTGSLAYSIVYGRQQRSWSIPQGGSGKLTDGLVAFLEEHGARILCGRKVARLVLENGRCAGVETEDGERYLGTKAVVSTIHVKHLINMAPHDVWPEDFHFGVETYDIGITSMAAYIAAEEPPEFSTRQGTQTAVSAGLAGWPEDMVRIGRDMKDGKFITGIPWLLVATPTLADPSRAPHGHHTVKLLSPQSWQLPLGDWSTMKEKHADYQVAQVRKHAPNFTDGKILARLVKSPDDFEQSNPHMIHGAFHGGDRGLSQSGSLRPVPGWSQYRMPIPGLYQTGGTTHPGGSITGAPGRNAAMVILQDLGTTLEQVLGASTSLSPSGERVGRGAFKDA
jgi:phytoene dehydrogenase-like protein